MRRGIVFAALIGLSALGATEASAVPQVQKPMVPFAAAGGTIAVPTVNCPTVADKLPQIPASAAAEVQRNLELLQTQINEANNRLRSTVGQGGPNFIQNAILGPLASKRGATIDRIAIAIGRTAQRPTGLGSLANCTLNNDAGQGQGQGQPPAPAEPTASAEPTAPAETTAPPDPADPAAQPIPAESFVDIRQVRPNVNNRRQIGRNGSAGSFVSRCGTNANGHHNSDNFIVAPGVVNGAHHTHDYVGNLSTDGFSTDQSLEAAGTTCQQNDKSTYFWPVLRVRRGAGDVGQDGNVGTILRPVAATMQFRGNQQSKVAEMPKFLRVITGNAKAVSQAGANAAAQWTCTGFQNRVTQKYPLCPGGSMVLRILDFPSCWDGKNVDSANHRTHVLFPDRNSGACPAGTRAIPQLRMTLAYNVPQNQGRAIALDSFPEEQHDPVTDHADFEQVMPQQLNQRIVACVNTGRRC